MTNPKVSVYMNEEDQKNLHILEVRWGVGRSEAVRRAILKAIKYNGGSQ